MNSLHFNAANKENYFPANALRLKLAYLGLVLLWCLSVVWKVFAHPIHYETVDSKNYHYLSKQLLTGKAFQLNQVDSETINHLAPYPPGYPVLLMPYHLFLPFLPDWQIGLLLNLTLGIVLFWLSWSFFKKDAFWIGLSFFFDHFMEISCHGWSEMPFLIFLLISIFTAFYKWKTLENLRFFGLLILLLCLCLTRFAGLFLVPAILFLAFQPKEKIWLKTLLFTLAMSVLVVYAFWLKAQTGFLTGGPRYGNSLDMSVIIKQSGIGIWNALLPIRDFSTDVSLLVSVLQSAIVLLFLFLSYKNKTFGNTQLFLVFIGISMIYLVCITSISAYFYFAEPLDFRLLAPFSFLFWYGLGLFVAQTNVKSIKSIWLILFLAAFTAEIRVNDLVALLHF